MKKFFNKNTILSFIVGALFFSGITAFAITNYNSDQVLYKKGTDDITVTSALDELYTLSETKIEEAYQQGWKDKPFNLTLRAVTSYGTNCTPETGINVSSANSFTNDGTWKILKITDFSTDTNKTWPISVRNTSVTVKCDSVTLGSSATIGTTYDISNCTEIKIGVSGKGYGSCQTGSTSTHAGITCVVTAN